VKYIYEFVAGQLSLPVGNLSEQLEKNFKNLYAL